MTPPGDGGFADQWTRIAPGQLGETPVILQALIEAAPLAIIACDAEGRVRLWNHSAERIFGWSAKEVLGQRVPFVPNEEWPAARAGVFVRQVAVSLRRMRKDGTPIDVCLWSNPLRDASGKHRGTLVIFDDVTERNRRESQIRHTQRLDDLGALTGVIAHDFSNILALISGHLGIVRTHTDGGSIAGRSVAAMDHACNRAERLVRQIRAAAHSTEGVREPINAATVVRDALRLAAPQIPPNIRVSSDVRAESQTVLGDSALLSQVLANLLANAVEAIGSAAGNIQVLLDSLEVKSAVVVTALELHRGTYVVVSVADDGQGLSAETIQHAFEPFFTTAGQKEGRGLGLAVVRSIVKMHGGAIRVTSQPGGGAKFEIFLPALVDATAAKRRSDDAIPRSTRNEHILIIDDDEAVLELMHLVLEPLGYQVTGYARAQQALAAYERDPGGYDLVLTDMSMPGLNGLEVAERILAIRSDARVVITTGYLESDGAEEAKRRGALDVVAKGVTASELAPALRRWLSD